MVKGSVRPLNFRTGGSSASRAASHRIFDFSLIVVPSTKAQATDKLSPEPALSSVHPLRQALWNGDVRVAFNGDFWPNVLERASRKAAPVLISINRSLP
jgi:hypothetical protein